MPHDDSRVLDAAERAAVLLNAVIDRSPRRLLYVSQMRDSVGSVGGNIAEGYGRRVGPDRTFKFEIARGEAEETLNRLRVNFKAGRLAAREYWRIRNLLVTVVKMLDSMINH
jgi:four helix bundle protein